MAKRPYTYWRIKRILKEHYNCRLSKVWGGYKATRSPYFIQKYHIVHLETEEVVVPNITLQGLRELFTKQGYSLTEKTTKINQGAKDFLEAVNRYSQSK